ncbi:hypothetical protein SPI_03135 [Niveomyces insectorum RCEF 264]|uniref:Uncharacterized protein n=1 Tax=Niveomyces insectorum RCEF 264 TaxID=1081102 RepID=A0A167X3M8_9HYPO|nr:hypothetical protein SPI_03135 [Niveomyces insectorum RCEF 264]
MEEEDDSGNIVDGVTYAASTAASPTKEKMNISRKKSRRSGSPSAANAYVDSDSTLHPRPGPKMRSSKDRERDRSVPPSKRSVTLGSRPAGPKHSRTEPVLDPGKHRRRSRDESSYYGVNPATVTSASSRPRSKTAAPRPASYYEPSRPPVSSAKYHMMQPPPSMMPPPPPPQTVMPGPGLPPPGYPPQRWAHPPPPAFAMMPPPPPPPPGPLGPHAVPHPPSDYSSLPPRGPPKQNLRQRFNLNRPQTSMGHRPPPAVEYEQHGDPYDPDELAADMRHLSVSHRPGLQEERSRMMPMRPVSARPSFHASPFAPPPALPPARERLVQYGCNDEPFDDPPAPGYHGQPAPYEYGPLTHVSRARRQSIGPPPMLYDSKGYTTEVAHTNGSRRNSLYGARSVSSGSGFEDKLRLASSYQDEVSGGMRLTAETLHEASRTGGPSSRSTRSSGSRDESDWRQSATTRTTRSSNEEDLTIRVKGNALFKYGEAEMRCQDGTEINITSRGPPSIRRPGGSEKSTYAESDDRRSRFERPALRGRGTSQAGSVYAPPPGPLPLEYSYGGGVDYNTSPFTPHPTPYNYAPPSSYWP